MIDVLNWIFGSFWHYAGTCFLLMLVSGTLCSVRCK